MLKNFLFKKNANTIYETKLFERLNSRSNFPSNKQNYHNLRNTETQFLRNPFQTMVRKTSESRPQSTVRFAKPNNLIRKRWKRGDNRSKTTPRRITRAPEHLHNRITYTLRHRSKPRPLKNYRAN